MAGIEWCVAVPSYILVLLTLAQEFEDLGYDMEYIVRGPHEGASTTLASKHAHHLLHCVDELRTVVWADHY